MRCGNRISACTVFVGKEFVKKWRKCSGKRRHRVEVANYRKTIIVLKQACNGQKFIDIEQRSKVQNIWNWIKVSRCQNLRVLDHFTTFALSWGLGARGGGGGSIKHRVALNHPLQDSNRAKVFCWVGTSPNEDTTNRNKSPNKQGTITLISLHAFVAPVSTNNCTSALIHLYINLLKLYWNNNSWAVRPWQLTYIHIKHAKC